MVSSDSAGDITEALAVFLLGQPTALAKLLAQHVDDGTGRCRVCMVAQRGHLPWPCALRIAADRARELGQGKTP
jgi:hypothetical protein